MIYQSTLPVIVPERSNNKTIIISLVWFLLLFVLVSHASANEKILQFHSDITVHEDSTMTVCETIKVISENREINHGIYRDFPTRYKDTLGKERVAGFRVLSVKRDGEPENYFIKTLDNGKRVYIGEKKVFIPQGIHTFEIRYKTDKQLAFFEDHDELYWNVTGNDWSFPIEEASATVHLPVSIPRKDVKTAGYTGHYGAKGTDFNSRIDDNGNIHFDTTKSLQVHEGLTIVVAWPKGFIKLSNLLKRSNFVQGALDRISVVPILLILGILVLLLYYLIVWYMVG
ncbi:MAG TPA: DUF2207 domain-containing protein, partial [Candidatus Brocadiaceae bacterium]